MKTSKLKNIMTVFAVLATISFSTIVKADDIQLPVVAKPSALDEGTQRELTLAQIADILPWAKNSKTFLGDLLESVQGLTSADQVDRLVEGITSVVGESAPKNTELLMRYSLNRGLVVNNIITAEMASDEVGTIDAKLRVLRLSIQMALKYYDNDMDTLNKKTKSPFVLYGTEYFIFLNEINKSVFDASAQYNIQKAALEWLQWDLYRDLNNASYAPQILKINNAVKVLPKTKLSDKQSLTYIRQMKQVSVNLNVESIREEAAKNNVVSVAKVIPSAPKSNSTGFRVGDTVNTNNRTIGIITKIFSDGIIVVTVDGQNSNYYEEQLEIPLKCVQDFCVNQTVVTNDHETGIIINAFSDNFVTVLINGKAKNFYTNQISIPIKSIGGFSVNQKVVTTDYFTGIITQVFSDNMVHIFINGSTYSYYTTQIGLPLKCINDFCAGDVVDTRDHETGKIIQVFQNGMTIVSINGKNENYYTTQLLK